MVGEIDPPSLEEVSSIKPEEPIYNANLMRISDMATLLLLISWKFIEENNETIDMDADRRMFKKQLVEIAKCGLVSSITDENCTIDKINIQRLQSCVTKLSSL